MNVQLIELIKRLSTGRVEVNTSLEAFYKHYDVMSTLKDNAEFNMNELERRIISFIRGYMLTPSLQISVNGILLMLKHGIIKNEGINLDDIEIIDHLCTYKGKSNYIDILKESDYLDKLDFIFTGIYLASIDVDKLLDTTFIELNLDKGLDYDIDIINNALLDIQYNPDPSEREHYLSVLTDDNISEEDFEHGLEVLTNIYIVNEDITDDECVYTEGKVIDE